MDLRRWAASAGPDALLPPLRHGQRAGPVTVLEEAALAGATLLRVRFGDGGEVLAPVIENGGKPRRAAPGDGVSARILEAREPLEITRLARWEVAHGAERRLPVDQTHDGVVVDDEVLVKWQVDVAPGAPSAPSLLAHLAAVGFTDATPAVATMTWNGTLVAQVLRYLPGARDGWSWLVEDLELALAAGTGALPLDGAARIGNLLGDFHAAVARPSAILPTPVTIAADLAPIWRHHAEALAQAGLVDPELAVQLSRWRPSFEEALRTLAKARSVPTVRVHGDAHVGQVLRWAGGLALGDFDGNPLLGSAERATPLPTALDVAAMRRSLDHAARVVGHRGASPRDEKRLRAWSAAARAAFDSAYLETRAAALLDRDLQAAFEVLTVLHEALYAARFLPAWRYVPLAVLTDGVDALQL